MRSSPFWLSLLLGLLACSTVLEGSQVRVLALYSENVEPDHVAFAHQAIEFFSGVAKQNGIGLETSTQWGDWDATRLRDYQLVIWLNDFPHTQPQREAFEQYMRNGGAWLGFHVAAYNDKDTNWPWFVDFLGGAVFYSNNWPPLPAKLRVDDARCPLTLDLPGTFLAPANEWYIWKPSPRLNPDVKVLLTFDPENYPLGLKDVLVSGDLPVVWTNRKYRMLYLNMGHGDKIVSDSTQNRLFEHAFLWFTKKGNQSF